MNKREVDVSVCQRVDISYQTKRQGVKVRVALVI